MSEAERKRRFDYKQNRSKWIRILAFSTAVILLLTIISAALYYNTNKNYYISYTEKSEIDYTVFLKENEFYDEEYLGKDKVYIASLIDSISADFLYELNMEEAAEYSYSYQINAVLEIADRISGLSIYRPSEALIPKTAVNTDGASKTLVINKQVEIDYNKYNNIANQIINLYKLEDITSSIVLEMEIEVVSACDSFMEENSKNEYTASLNIPLTEQKVHIQATSSVPLAESKILACTQNAAKTVFLILTIVLGILSVLCIAFFVFFIFATRNTDIDYEIKVNKIISNYKSYIQQIVSPFDDKGYQLLYVKDFVELLEIRDTIQAPILMNENADKTCTRFIIPTNTKLMYVFEIKVDDYDEIYGATTENKHFERIVETNNDVNVLVVDENVDDNELIEALEQPDVSLESIDFIDEIDEEDEEGTEVVGVVWPEKSRKNKIYRYDPNGEQLNDGDIVLVPSRDEAQNKDIIRKAAVAHGNHKVAPETIHHPLKKVIAIIKKKTQEAITPDINKTK